MDSHPTITMWTKLTEKMTMSKERDYNQIDALKYLVETGPSHTDEWTEAGMYRILSKIIMDGSRRYEKKELDELLDQASNGVILLPI